MIDGLFNLLFRCRHSRLTRPMAPISIKAVPQPSYRVCLDCGARFSYDTGAMRTGKRIPNDVQSGEIERPIQFVDAG